MGTKHYLTILILFTVFSIIIAHRSQFAKYKPKFNKKYNNAAIQSYRQAIFNDNLNKIKKHNQNPKRTYNEGINKFTDLTQAEFQQNYLGLKLPQAGDIEDDIPNENPDEPAELQNNKNLRNLQTITDWRETGVVTPVKDQGMCGSCWAFSANGAMESLSIIYDGQKRIFSQQQLIDCSRPYGNYGCGGGLMTKAFKYVIYNGIELQSSYPYVGKDQFCKKKGGSFRISSYTNVIIGSSSSLISALSKGPVSVAVDATNWPGYSSGIFNNCGTNLNHGVLLVAIVNNNWVIKNSWGVAWGEQGFIALAAGNTCGILNFASYPKK